MAILTTGLETIDYETEGWSAIESANVEKIDLTLRGPFLADEILGSVVVADPAGVTAENLTDSTGGSVSNTISAVSGSGADAGINDNFASLTDEVKKLRSDVVVLSTLCTTLLAALRKTGGCGVLDDNP